MKIGENTLINEWGKCVMNFEITTTYKDYSQK
jgi:hypothetical protein